MKKEYNLKTLKKRKTKSKAFNEASKVPISIRLDAIVLADLRTEAERLGLPYQTFIGSVLHRYVTGELVDKNTPDLKKWLKVSSGE